MPREAHINSAEVFGRIVALLRSRVGLSSRDLAAQMGGSIAAVGRLEAGRTLPNFPVAARVAGILSRTPTVTDRVLEPWNALLLHDLLRSVLSELEAAGYQPLWIMRGKSLPQPAVTGRAIAQLVELPARRWLEYMETAGWPQCLLDHPATPSRRQ
ncbi:MAG: helix-turn-helix transcriptional regulator [Candidatus Poseidoniia archaeon]